MSVLAATLALTTGCSHDSSDDSGRRTHTASRPSVPAPTQEVRDLVLPLDQYALDSPQVARIAAAQDRLIAACMARQGLDWKLLPERSTGLWPHRGRYGLIEPEPAERYGYHALPDPESETKEARIAEREKELTAEQRAAAYGKDGTSGCEQQAERELLRGVPKVDFGVVDRVSQAAYEKSQRDPAVRKAFARWSSCMRAKGFSYADPMAANNDPAWNADAKTPTRAEIATARADVTCKRRTSLVSVWWKADIAYQKRAIKERAGQFGKIRAARTRYLANVEAHAAHGAP
ncbi:hypothetical protein ACH4FX_20155 [Streptomyces sp. NPDC018019]|uniref:hypothetical protein n=1 Tax=Streptomyces sp. NPDC018019 TaxID=3365030 RepID=UPI00379023EB